MAGGSVAGVGKLVNGLGRIGLAGIGISALASGAEAAGKALGVGLNVELENVHAQLTAFTKSGAEADRILADIRKEASLTPFAFQEMAKATASLLPASKQSGVALNDLIKQAEILAASNPAEGLEGAAFALKEALGGDFVSIVERFNLPRQRLNELKDQGVPAMEAISIAMKEMGLDADLVTGLAGTFSGKLSTFQDTIDTLRATASKPLFDQMKIGLGTLQAFLNDNQETIAGWATAFGEAIGKVIGFLIGNLPAAIQAVQGAFQTIGPVLSIARDAVVTFIGALTGDWAGQASGAIEPFVQAIGNIGVFIRENVMPAITEFVGLVQQAFSGDVAGAVTGLLDMFVDGRTDLVETMGGWAKALIEWIAPAIPPLLAEAARIAEAVFRWAQEKVPELVEKFKVWGQAIVEFVAPFIPPLLAELGKLASDVLAWIAAQAPSLMQMFITQWVPSAINWVLQAAIDILPELLKLSSKILDWIIAEGPGLATKFLTEWLPAVLGWVAQAIIDIVPKLAELIGVIGAWVINEGAPKAATAFIRIGGAIIDGINDGIVAAAHLLFNKLRELANAALAEAKKALGISSPSREFADEVGVPMVEGIIRGLLGESPALQAAIATVVTEAVESPTSEATTVVSFLAGFIRNDLVTAWEVMGQTTHDIFDDLRGDINSAIARVEELASAIRSLPNIPSMPGGGGGGEGQPPVSRIPEWGFGNLSQINYITNTIDARGLDPAAVTRASGQDLADLSRRLLTAGV